MRLRPLSAQVCVLAIATATGWAAGLPAEAHANGTWNPKAAATYLDRRAGWWVKWPGAARDHETFCLSCHTAVAYSIARPKLRAVLGEATPSENENRIVQNAIKRVHLWKEIKPYYGGGNTSRSRGTEAVLNALILSTRDANPSKLSDDARAAFENMWALQLSGRESQGAWEWIQFNNEPWEAHDSQYYGAALAAVAVGNTPESYRAAPEIQHHLRLLSEYLNREFAAQSPINQAVVLWAGAHWPELLTSERRRALVHSLMSRQLADGGWSLDSLVWTWRDWSFITLSKLFVHGEATPLRPKSEGYATGLVTFALQQSGIRQDDPGIQRARAWLVRNETDGRWPAHSPNGKRDHAEGEGLFMDDAATAYAVMALAQ